MKIAFKEWAVIVDALGRGEQIVVLRKGGLQEGPAGFQVEHPEFLLFPTRYHQQTESVLPSARQRSKTIAAQYPEEDILRLEYHATVAGWQRLDTLEKVRRLRGQHIWKEEVLEQRYAWGEEANIFALALRVYRLPHSVDLPMAPTYGGCKSWVELESDISTDASMPVLDEQDFAGRLNLFREKLSLNLSST